MDSIKGMFDRMKLHKVQEFIVNSGERLVEHDSHSYYNRLESSAKPVYKRLEQIYMNSEKLTEASSEFSNVLSIFEEVYTEIGMNTGARLVIQLLFCDDNIDLSNEKGNKGITID